MKIDDAVLATDRPDPAPFINANGVKHRNGTILRDKHCLINGDILVVRSVNAAATVRPDLPSDQARCRVAVANWPMSAVGVVAAALVNDACTPTGMRRTKTLSGG